MFMLKLTFSEISTGEVSPLFLVSASVEVSNKFVVANEYIKNHIFELRRKIWRQDWSTLLYTQLEQLWNKSLKKIPPCKSTFKCKCSDCRDTFLRTINKYIRKLMALPSTPSSWSQKWALAEPRQLHQTTMDRKYGFPTKEVALLSRVRDFDWF